MSRTTEELEVPQKPKRVAVKRARSSAGETVEKPKRAPRKKVVVESKSDVPSRKAPTQLATKRVKKYSLRRHIAVLSLLLILGIAGSAFVGFTDKGQIDVMRTISERNTQASVDNPDAIMVPVQSTTQEPDGGLIGLGIGGSSQPTSTPAIVASSTPPIGQSPLPNAEAEAIAAETVELDAQ